ncbi:hypothetical protein [Streptomyces sp. NPDC093589]|uniref:hypothetical protein n=1 Tax=Streptomyces sp. NPDC093589 TaxID=3366043 RepID=UPI003829120D
MGDSPRISLPGQRNHGPITAPNATHGLVLRGEEQEIAATLSRRTGPRRWVRSVTWLISAGLHPRANATTLRVAEDLASRMDYDLGHVLYDLEGTAARLGVDRATVKRHVKYLRELGALAFVVHGTQLNSRRARGLNGYAATATTYAATIPPRFDHAMGHRLIGTGYEARIVIDHRDQTPVDNEGRAPLSLTVDKEVGKQKVVGGRTTTGKPAATDSTPTTKTASSKKRATILGNRISAAGAQLADQLARTLRSRFPWLRRATHDQVRWICADMGERSWTEQQAINFASDAADACRGAGHLWQPERPQAILAAHLRKREEQHLAEQRRGTPQDHSLMDNAAWEAVYGTKPRAAADDRPTDGYTDIERSRFQMYGWQDFGMVAADYADDPDDAIDLYGTTLVTAALNQTSRREISA